MWVRIPPWVLSLLVFSTPLSAQQKALDTTKVTYYLLTQDANIVKYQPPSIYKTWWDQIILCTKLQPIKHTFGKIQFYSVDADEFLANGTNALYVGYTYPEILQIYIIKKLIYDEVVVKHELSHILLWQNNIADPHSPLYYRVECKNALADKTTYAGPDTFGSNLK